MPIILNTKFTKYKRALALTLVFSHNNNNNNNNNTLFDEQHKLD